MHKSLKNVLGATAAVFLSSIAVGATETVSADWREKRVCAAWDVYVTTLIEDFGANRLASSDLLYATALEQLKARSLCRSGRVQEAYQIYEQISLPNCVQAACSSDEATDDTN